MSRDVILVWWKSFRPFSLVSSALPALFGTMYAAWQGFEINLLVAVVSTALAVLLHLITNLTNSLYDWLSGHDTPGGPQVIPLLETDPMGITHVRCFLQILAGLTVCLTIVFGALTSWTMMFWPTIGYLGGVYYTKPPIAYKHRGWGAAAVFLLLGVATPLAAFLAQTNYTDYQVILAFVPIACLVTAIMLANEIRDYHSDKLSGSTTLVVTIGTSGGKLLYGLCLLGAYATILFGALRGFLPKASLAVFLSTPLLLRLVSRLRRNHLLGLDYATAQFYGTFCILYTLVITLMN